MARNMERSFPFPTSYERKLDVQDLTDIMAAILSIEQTNVCRCNIMLKPVKLACIHELLFTKTPS